MTILVTGGTGFLGSYFTRYAVQEHAERVVILDKYIDAGRIEDVLDQVTLIEGDVSDADVVNDIVHDHNVDRIAHFAFILGSPAPGQMLPYVRVQSLGLANVFEAARLGGVKRVLFASSVAAYGRQDVSVLTEDLPCDPAEPYGFCKVWGEALGRHYTRELGLEVVSLRFGSTYGLGRAARGSYAAGLFTPPKDVHYMARIELLLRGASIEMPSAGVLADFTYAADAAQASWRALMAERLPHHLYNVCAEQRRVGDFTEAMRELAPDADVVVLDGAMPDRPHQHMDGSRLKEDLGFVPQYSLKAGLEDYAERVRAYQSFKAKQI